MKLTHTLTLALLLGLLTGCGMLKTVKLMKSGSVRQPVFKTEVPFEMRLGLAVIKVTIHGQEYSFLIDTGAPDVISKELAQQLGIKSEASRKAGDSQGNNASLGFTSIDSIGIGGLQFLNTGAAIADLKQSAEVACFKVDGLIGANLMRKAVWQFDYERNIVTITNTRSSLSIPSNALKIKFKTLITGTPIIDLRYNGLTDRNVTVDLGSNGDFNSSHETFKLLKKNGLRTNLYSYGYGTSGLYGRGKEDTTWYALVSTIRSDSLRLSNQVIAFTKKGAKTVGTNFFKNYLLIFDWSLSELTMIPVKPYSNTLQEEFSYGLVLQNGKVTIGKIYSTGIEAPEGPQFGDQVLELNGKDYRNCSADNWCDLLNLRFDNAITSLTLLVKRGDKELNFSLTKEALFLKK